MYIIHLRQTQPQDKFHAALQILQRHITCYITMQRLPCHDGEKELEVLLMLVLTIELVQLFLCQHDSFCMTTVNPDSWILARISSAKTNPYNYSDLLNILKIYCHCVTKVRSCGFLKALKGILDCITVM